LVGDEDGDCRGEGNHEDRKEVFCFHILVWFICFLLLDDRFFDPAAHSCAAGSKIISQRATESEINQTGI